jgi:hypothetical protein
MNKQELIDTYGRAEIVPLSLDDGRTVYYREPTAAQASKINSIGIGKILQKDQIEMDPEKAAGERVGVHLSVVMVSSEGSKIMDPEDWLALPQSVIQMFMRAVNAHEARLRKDADDEKKD